MGLAEAAHWHVNVFEEVSKKSSDNANGENSEVQGNTADMQSIYHPQSQSSVLNSLLKYSIYSVQARNETTLSSSYLELGLTWSLCTL